MALSRRSFLKTCAAASAYGALARAESVPSSPRQYHVCLAPDSMEAYPDLLDVVARAGIEKIWIPAFLYGYWPYPAEQRLRWRRRIEEMGMEAGAINVPLGHPGDSLGAMHGNIPLTPPDHWRMGTLFDGGLHSGTSLHEPAIQENVAAVSALAEEGQTQIFLDDDFRLAVGPGRIGGCFCDEHKQEFLRSRGFGEEHWTALLEAVQERKVCPALREWTSFTCDALTSAFRAQQAAAPKAALGNMVMYLGAEKAGIRLSDYKDVLFRVGELMFNDASFAPVKGKTDELFSALFHRRYARPELAYSETTAYPADQLSAANMAAKLAVSTIADVRTTMYMSGLSPFPLAHWDVLAPAMRHHAALHQAVAGSKPQGPLKHYWGEYSRLAGDDVPYSLFLAMGIPFEVCDAPAKEGYTFLADADAVGLREKAFVSAGTTFIARKEMADCEAARSVPETLDDLFAFKQTLLPELQEVPYVAENLPVVCAWYPSVNKALLWNLSDTRETFTIKCRGNSSELAVDGLGAALAEL